MILFAHTKFGLVRINGSGVKRGPDSLPPRPERLFEIPAWIGLKLLVGNNCTLHRRISISTAAVKSTSGNSFTKIAAYCDSVTKYMRMCKGQQTKPTVPNLCKLSDKLGWNGSEAKPSRVFITQLVYSVYTQST